MDFLGVFFILILTTLLGYFVIDLFVRDKLLASYKYIVGFGVGYGLIALLLILLQLTGVAWSWPAILTIIIFVVIFYFVFRQFWQNPVKLSLGGNRLVAILLVLLIGFVLFESLIRPLSSWDGWSSWEMRAKVISIDKKISIEQFNYLQTEYPLVVPLYTTFVYGVIGNINDNAILIVSWYFYFLIGALSLLYLSKKTTVSYAVFFTFLILSTQNLIRHGGRYEGGLADIIMSYFVLSVLVLLSFFIEKKKVSILVLLSIFLGIVANIKNEGIFFSAIVFLATLYYLFRMRQLGRLFILLFYIVPLLVWLVFKMVEPLPHGILSIHPQISLQILIHLAAIEFDQFTNIQNWNFGWLFIIAATIHLFIKRKLNGILIVLIVLAISYSFIFLFSKVDPVEHAKGVLDRLLLHIFPAFVIFVSTGLYPFIKNHRLLKRFGLV